MRRLDDVVLWEGRGEDTPDPVCVQLQGPAEGNTPDLRINTDQTAPNRLT